MAKIEAVIFDMDGVLVDTEMLNVELLEDFLRERYGRELGRDVSFPLVGSTKETFWAPISKALALDEDINAIDADLEAYVTARDIAYHGYCFADSPAILRLVKERGYKMALATSSEDDRARIILERCGLGGFDVITTGSMFVERKPNPEIYLATASRLGVDPAYCVAVEDSAFGIEAATRAGMTVVARRELRFGIDQSRAAYMIDRLLELPAILDAIESR